MRLLESGSDAESFLLLEAAQLVSFFFLLNCSCHFLSLPAPGERARIIFQCTISTNNLTDTEHTARRR
jgi:hypothetical protein